MMAVEIIAESISVLPEYALVPIAFQVESRFRIEPIEGGLGGLAFEAGLLRRGPGLGSRRVGTARRTCGGRCPPYATRGEWIAPGAQTLFGYALVRETLFRSGRGGGTGRRVETECFVRHVQG